jgi:hypothetical protein
MKKIVHYIGLDVHKETGAGQRAKPQKIQIPDKLQNPNFNATYAGSRSPAPLRVVVDHEPQRLNQ